MKTIIHVNQHILKKNKKFNLNDPPLTIKTYKENINAHSVEILGPSKVVYSPDKQLNCGAVCWVETQSKIIIN